MRLLNDYDINAGKIFGPRVDVRTERTEVRTNN